jgi:hypothetical protein
MRRSLSLFSVALALAGACCGVATAASVEHPGGPIVCPGTAPVSPPCCGSPGSAPREATSPVVIPCCEPPTPICVHQLTISSSPDPSTAGQAVTISGRLLGTGAGTGVKLWQRLPGAQKWVSIATTTTDVAGSYKFVRRGAAAATNRQWSVSTVAAASPVIVQQVRARVTLKVITTVFGGQIHTSFSGTVAPAHRGEKVILQRLAGGHWLALAHLVLKHGSAFALTLRLQHGRLESVRVVLRADRRNILSRSPRRSAEV